MNSIRPVMAMAFGMLLVACTMHTPAQEPLDKKTAERITQLRKDMLLRRAQALVQYEPIYQELETLLPKDNGAASDINRYKAERDELAGYLLACGKQSVIEKNFVQAEECLDLSNQLASNNEKQILLDKARATRKQQDEKRQSEQIMQSYQQAYASGNLVEAHTQLDMLLALLPENSQAVILRDQLNTEISSRMNKNLEEARTLYSQGKINEALVICNNSLRIDPKNEELLAMISRAEKVNKNIEKLSKTKK